MYKQYFKPTKSRIISDKGFKTSDGFWTNGFLAISEPELKLYNSSLLPYFMVQDESQVYKIGPD